MMIELLAPAKLVLHDTYLYILLAFIVFDVVTGTLKAFTNHTVYSKISKKGVTSHITIILFCLFFSWVLNVFHVGEYSKVLVMFYIVSYALSIFENLGEMGLPLPEWLTKRFETLKDETNKGEYHNETKRP